MTMLRGKFGGLIAFAGIAALVVGGLGWVTREALRMEDERSLAAVNRDRDKLQKEQDERWQEHLQQIAADRNAKMRSALMLLDSRLTPALAREDSRPYSHYEAMHSPFPAITWDGLACEPGQFMIPSPLMTAGLPDWMLLHFQVDPVKGWTSPQVVPEPLQRILRKQPIELALHNVDDAHAKLLDDLKAAYPTRNFLATLRAHGIDYETVNREMQQSFQDLNVNPANGFNQNYFGQNAVPQPQTGQSNALANSGVEQANDQGKRYQIISRGKNEGLWAYLNDGRSYSSMQGMAPSKALGTKQREIEALEKQLESGYTTAEKNDFRARIDTLKKESEELRKALQPVEVELTSMQPLWLPNASKPKHLLMIRPARVGNLPAYQGILLDWPRLQEILKTEIEYLLPEARFVPLAKTNPEQLDREMFALPIELDAGPLPQTAPLEPVPPAEAPAIQWSPLRIGLALAWVAAMIALLAVGLGGWTLLDLSERRIRFVSAVTHELRTPLTTLRLYLDLLNSGLVSDATQRDEYIKTLGGEADRLHRLIGNVLDFARLEKTRPATDMRPIGVSDILDQLRQDWGERCAASNKELTILNTLQPEATITTDRNLVEQILGNLIDNARKYSQDAKDPHIWIRAIREGSKLILEVEDRGPGVTKRERNSIFRPFRRGIEADVKAGGVGLGLALATRWAAFIGGRLDVQTGANGVGACFRLELPA